MTVTRHFGKRRRYAPALLIVALLQVACSSLPPWENPEDWIGFTYVVDGEFEVRVRVPPAEHDKGIEDIQFVATGDEPVTVLLRAGYDPGWGRNRGLLLTDISVRVRPVQTRTAGGPETMQDVREQLYGEASPDPARYAYEGIRRLGGRDWLRVRLVEEEFHAIDPVEPTSPEDAQAFSWAPPGMRYATPLGGHLVLELDMTMDGKDADSRLFKRREQTLEEIARTVEVSPVEIQ